MPDKTRTGWTTVAFGDVVRKINDKVDADTSGLERYIAGEHMDSNDLKIWRWGTIGDGYLGPAFHMRFRPGQVLYGSRRTYLRKVAVAEFEGICANTTFVLEAADSDLLLPEFLPYLMQTESFHEHSELNSKGSVNPYINFSDLAQYEFDLPPLETQRTITTALEAHTQAIVALRRLSDGLIKLRDAYSNYVFSKILVEGDQGLPLGDIFDQIKETGFSDLSRLSVTITGQILPRSDLGRRVEDETGDGKYLRVLPGDLAYNTMRLWQGAIGIAQQTGLVSPAYTVLRPKPVHRDSINYLLEMLRSPALVREYRRFATGVAKDRWRVYFKDLSTIRVSLPDSVELNRTASNFNWLDQCAKDLTQRRSDSESLRGATQRTLMM